MFSPADSAAQDATTSSTSTSSASSPPPSDASALAGAGGVHHHAARLPAELHRPFRFVAIDWSIVPPEAVALIAGLLDELLALGARVALTAGGALAELLPQLGAAIRAANRKRLFVCTDGASGLHGFDRRGAPIAIAIRNAIPIEVGGGALAALIAQEIAPLKIPPADRLVVVREPSEPLGDGSLCAAPALADAVRVAADAQRLAAILALQRDVERELGQLATPRDAAWVIEEPGFDIAREHEIESLLTIANGYLGSRGSIAEGSSVSRPATLIAGAFEPSADVSRVPELVIAPDWGRLRLVVEGEPFSVESCDVIRNYRHLDMRRGVLLRDCVGRDRGGHLTELRTLHAASLARRHVLLEAVSVAPLNFTGKIRVDAILSGDVRSASGAAHWQSFMPEADAQSIVLAGRTRGGLVTSMTSQLRVQLVGDERAACERAVDERSIAERCELHVRLAERRELHRTATLHTSRDGLDPDAAGQALRRELSARSMEELLREHERAWAERWRRADVEIDGAPKIERSLRFGLYHLLGTANPDDPRCSIGARALTGEAYRGHVFWDTEIFLVPFYTHCYPEAARALLLYRHGTLAGAKRKAKALGYEGALYAWESADTGDETTPPMVVSPFGEVVRVLSGEQEHHISADVAYAVHAYARATGDVAFERREGLEILVETARFWASRAAIEADGLAHIRRIIGPDEYHEGVDDNAFTNWMARHNLRAAAAAVRRAGAVRDLPAELALRPEEVDRWSDVADRMYLGVDPKTGLIEQFSGYFGLEPFSIAWFSMRSAPIDMLLGRERTQACQVVKQADVVALLALLWSQVDPAARRNNFLYYEPRTAHGSSLSPGTHALVAARLGLTSEAERYFEQTADIDLGNTMGNVAGGVHIAAMGSLWQAVVFGVAGIHRVPAGLVPGDEEAIGVAPRLLPGWRHLKIPLGWRGRALEIHVEPSAVEIAVEGERPLPLCVLEEGAPTRTVLAAPGRRYATRRIGRELGAWEEITS